MNSNKQLKWYGTFLAAVVLVTALVPATAPARQDGGIDKDLMKRDLEIMESVLDRLLAPHNESTIRISGSAASALYLPGFGVLIESSPGFRVQGVNFQFLQNGDSLHGTAVVERDRRLETEFFSGEAASGRATLPDVNADDLLDKITGFMKNYAGLINQLKPTDRVAVIYNNRGHVFLPGLRNRDEAESRLQSMSVVATFADLDAYRRGNLNDGAFGRRLVVRKVMSDDDPRTDLEIFGRILETGLKTDDRESISLRGNVSHFYVDGAGAIFNMQGGMSARGVFSVANMENLAARLQEQGQRIEQQAEQLRQQAREIEVMAKNFPGDSLNLDRQLNLINSRIEALYPDPEKLQEEFELFERNLKSYMVDYGRTLSTLKTGESLYLSVAISGFRRSALPGRVVYKINKDTIERFDRRNINRDQAIGLIEKIEY
ncbi:MAG: hypothetical protein ACNA8K_03060 [Cyclonatronaceae bacterium]